MGSDGKGQAVAVSFDVELKAAEAMDRLYAKAREATRNAVEGEPRCTASPDNFDASRCTMLDLHPGAHRSRAHGTNIVRWWPVDDEGEDIPGQIDGLYGAVGMAVNLVEQIAGELLALTQERP